MKATSTLNGPVEVREPSLPVKLLTAGTAACVADLITFPLDTAKVRLQVSQTPIKIVDLFTVSRFIARNAPYLISRRSKQLFSRYFVSQF